jgi:arsenate reductase (glutaredoxin)
MIVLLHNSRCSKSREALKFIKDSKKNFTLREYLKNPLDLEELQDLQYKLKLKAIEFTRALEPEFKEAGLDKKSDDNTILKAMVRFPKLMQRAIVFDESRAFICRPASEVLRIFKK